MNPLTGDDVRKLDPSFLKVIQHYLQETAETYAAYFAIVMAGKKRVKYTSEHWTKMTQKRVFYLKSG